MSQPLLSYEPTDVIHHLYLTAEAMRHIAETLPESQGGLALLIEKLGWDVEFCAIILDDTPEE